MTKYQDVKEQWQHIFKLMAIGFLWLCKWIWTIEIFLWKTGIILAGFIAFVLGIVLQFTTWETILHVGNFLLENKLVIIIIILSDALIGVLSKHPDAAKYAASLRTVQSTFNWRRLPPRILIVALVACLVLGLLGKVGLLMLQYTNPPAPAPPIDTGIHTQVIDGERIGISDGKDAFDTARLNNIYKEDAIREMSNGDTLKANVYWTMAANDDTADAEVKIYVENQCILGIGKRDSVAGENCIARPHKTILVVVPLSNKSDTINIGRDILQGAYITQAEYNQLHQNGPQLYLLIANIGEATTNSDGQAQVANQIMQAIKADPTIVGIVGWLPGSSMLVQKLNHSSLPMISTIPLEQPYIRGLLSVAHSLQDEARAATTYITDRLHATKIAVVYPTDGSDRGLGKDFIVESGSLKTTPIPYSVGSEYNVQEVANRVVDSDFDLIYFTGPFADIAMLHTALYGLTKGTSRSVQIMGSDITYQWIHASPNDISNFTGLSFTASAFPDEWSIRHTPISTFPFYDPQTAASQPDGFTKPPMVVDYKSAYDPLHLFNNDYVYDRADSDVILSYDATSLLATALCQTQGSSCDDSAQKSHPISADQLGKTIQKFTPGHAFQGISGQIAFLPGNSSAVNKAVLVLHILGNGTHSIIIGAGKY
ncbi:hypothetical protein KSF_034480 [Reticulibacter mediterranei]|uniref:Uncharacterized protein n=1 Tax=Reticulibacter mediterranei TaxID=2778369 RepID=A0A8J3N2P0_9CHLR|nr:hypothetical protein [Reticulibacter mediterranei]GHO93400.1 hypothetical protein KSF_034480 [Reticulibacter mediterranei]